MAASMGRQQFDSETGRLKQEVVRAFFRITYFISQVVSTGFTIFPIFTPEVEGNERCLVSPLASFYQTTNRGSLGRV